LLCLATECVVFDLLNPFFAAPSVKKSGVDATKISAAKKRKKATTLVVAKKGKKPAPKVAAPSTKSGKGQQLVRRLATTILFTQLTYFLQSLKKRKLRRT